MTLVRAIAGPRPMPPPRNTPIPWPASWSPITACSRPEQRAATEIAAFMATSPDWPFQYVLARRRDDALANDPDDGEVVAECAATPPQSPLALAHCADAYGRLGRTPMPPPWRAPRLDCLP